MKIRAYIDTNIFVYAILHHPEYGNICSKILEDFKDKVYEPYGSMMVALELFGSLSKINPSIARKATELYLSLDITILPLNTEALTLALLINEVVNIRYDAVHAAIMILNDIPVIITNDTDNWLKLSRNYEKVLEKLINEGYHISLTKVNVVTPNQYSKWYEKVKKGDYELIT